MIDAFFYYSGLIVWLLVALILSLLALTLGIDAFILWRNKR